MPLFALGYNVNFALSTGISECIGSDQIKKNINFWDDFGNFQNHMNNEGLVTADIVLKQNIAVETGVSYRTFNLVYNSDANGLYGNGNIKLNFSTIEIPVMAKFTIPISKTTDVINGINIGVGLNVSWIIGNQSYQDDLTSYVGNFVTPPFDFGLSMKVTYSHKIGPGNAFAGIKASYSFLSQGYMLGERNVNYGNIISVAPVIGYSFVIKEDKGISKVTEKNKRIKDIDVM